MSAVVAVLAGGRGRRMGAVVVAKAGTPAELAAARDEIVGRAR